MNSIFKRTVGHHRRRPARSSYVCKIPNTEISLFPDCPRFCRQSQISLIVWDGRRQIWRIRNVSIFQTRPRFLQWPVIIPDKWKHKFVSSGPSAMISLFTNPLNCWAPVFLSYICVHISIFGALSISRQIQYWENLGQTSGDYPVYRQNLGRSVKSKCRIVWDFPDIWKPGFKLPNYWQQPHKRLLMGVKSQVTQQKKALSQSSLKLQCITVWWECK